MSCLWLKCDPSAVAWQPYRLACDELALTPPLLLAEAGSSPAPPPRIKRFKSPTGAEDWLLIAAPGSVRINGELDRLGLRILQDRDEVQVRGFHHVYFSSERLAEVEKFPGGAHVVHCARCHDVVEQGSEVVCCPSCQTWYHQRPGRECWTYTEKCGLCPQPTALAGCYRWQPGQEDA